MGQQWFVSNESDTLTYDVTISGNFRIQAYNNETVTTTACQVRGYRFNKGNSVILQDALIGSGNTINPLSSGSDDILLNQTFALGPNEAIVLYWSA